MNMKSLLTATLLPLFWTAADMDIFNLPPGFRFYPTDQELIVHYLKQKTWLSLEKKSGFSSVLENRKYPNGDRPNRAAASGYWKATGTDKPILTSSGSQCLGVKKALVFYKGRPPKGIKTNWVMHEYRLVDDSSRSPRPKGPMMRLDDWVLCRVRQKSIISSPLSPGKLYSSFDHQCSTSNLAFQSSPDAQVSSSFDFQHMLESIKRTLSIGADLEECISMPPPTR
ncbi:hypothetical protein GIB67_039252 [Kingdonia uniflora]|uniref:NAC domain-containing protein n=1 Tax=Kingdonia uniflora TaxID=39325 RepID=A0A7J7MM29_9MAGN|nr:hypothetical protein GIB67_039252 [Kingdonia uniflora]